MTHEDVHILAMVKLRDRWGDAYQKGVVVRLSRADFGEARA